MLTTQRSYLASVLLATDKKVGVGASTAVSIKGRLCNYDVENSKYIFYRGQFSFAARYNRLGCAQYAEAK